MHFVDNAMLIVETGKGVNQKFELWKSTLGMKFFSITV